MLWIKALHIIFIICWFAGLFYLPRLFVYHALSQDAATRAHLQVMEHKLYRFMSLCALLALGFGLWLASYNLPYYLTADWFLLKTALVIALIVYHLSCGRFVQRLREGQLRSHTFYRIYNELPVLLLFPIVILVVVKPFG